MSVELIIVIAGICVVFFVLAAVVLGLPVFGGSGRSSMRNQMRSIVSSQRHSSGRFADRRSVGSENLSVFDTAKESEVRKKVDSRLTLEKKLKYAQWKISTLTYRACIIGISVGAAFVVSQNFNIVMTGMSLLTGPIFMNWLLNFHVDRRFHAFDEDYPQFLMSLVGLLKTGMNTMTALEASAQGLNEGSLVKLEVDMMVERLRFGVSEDKSIGSFGEDIFHPEIELFVQALLLSSRVGGTLSDTLDRLAKQVRKRQYFRNSANAAVGMQRGSIWFIILILLGLELYLYFTFPEAIVGAWNDELGWQVWQFGIVVILLGIFWIRQVTKIRV